MYIGEALTTRSGPDSIRHAGELSKDKLGVDERQQHHPAKTLHIKLWKAVADVFL